MAMEVERSDFATKGVAGTGLGLGIAGTALGLLNGGLGNVLGSGWGVNNPYAARTAAVDAAIPAMAALAAGAVSHGACSCSEDHTVNRYVASQAARIADLETEVKLRDANTYTDSKMLEMYQYVDGRLRNVESQICQQAVNGEHFLHPAESERAERADQDRHPHQQRVPGAYGQVQQLDGSHHRSCRLNSRRGGNRRPAF